MHIALKKIKNDLERFLKKGSEEQIIEIYDVALQEYCKTEKGMKEAEKIESYNDQISLLKTKIKKLQKPEVVKQDLGTQEQEEE